jgi:cobalt-zinc-cadmium efflux system protein
MATKKPTGKYTYGLRKTTILASILNALLLVGAAAIIAWNAIEKLKNPEQVFGTQIMIVAGVGVIINTLTALLFHKGQQKDLNIRGAFLHMAADAAVTLGVLLSGLLINLTGKLWIDPITSFIIIAIILWSTFKLLIDSIDLALDAVPKSIDIEEVKALLLDKKGVEGLHDLHVWALSTSMTALSVHLVMPEGTNDDFLAELQKELNKKFEIQHATIQTENEEIDSELEC